MREKEHKQPTYLSKKDTKTFSFSQAASSNSMKNSTSLLKEETFQSQEATQLRKSRKEERTKVRP
jgi:hypothetical protein